MRKWWQWANLIVSSAFVFVGISSTVSAGSTNAVIYQVQTGGASAVGSATAATQEYIAIYNNADQPLDVTNWCVVYASATDATQTQLGCLTPPDTKTRLIFGAYSSFTLTTNEFLMAHHDFMPDLIFNSGLSGSAGHIRLLDQAKSEIDRLGYGTAAHPETTVAPAPETGKILKRIGSLNSPSILQDNDNNSVDFELTTLSTLPSSGLYEEVVEVDVCPNIDGLQTELPPGYLFDEQGNCQQDICANLDGLQVSIPEGYESPDGENCSPISRESATLLITELLPNISGSDTGKEFIEIYNPNDRPVSLKDYVLLLGPSYSKTYPLPNDRTIAPGVFMAFSDVETGLTLPNTSADVRLRAPSGTEVSSTSAYDSPGADYAWALIDGMWQFTNRPTPSAANLNMLLEEDPVPTNGSSDLVLCRADQERNPETNRCRLIQSASASLVPCSPGQERNPATNRCRSILTSDDDLVPCKAGQERNPETNRCRSVASTASALVPCAEGQERNPETNRCRKVTGSETTGMAGVKDVYTPPVSSSPMWLLAGLGVTAALGYAGFEWRREIASLFGRAKRTILKTAN